MWLGSLILVFLASVPAAHAGFHHDLQALSAEGATLGLACGSADRAVVGLRTVAVALADGADDLSAWSQFQSLLSADPERGAFEQDGAFSVGTFSDGGVQVTLHTTLTAAVVAERVAVQAAGASIATDAGFVVQSQRGALYVRAVGPDVVIGTSLREIPAGPAPGEDRLLSSLPDLGPGCAVFGVMNNASSGASRVGAYVPLDGAAAGRFVVQSVAVGTQTGLLDALSAHAVAPEIRTPLVPSAWLTVGFGLADLDLSLILQKKELARAQKLQRYVPLAAGITVGAFLDGPPVVAAVLPLAQPWPARKVLRHVRHVLGSLDAKVVRLDPDRLQATLGSKPLVFGARRGAILVSSDASVVASLVQNEGQAWMTDQAREKAADWLVALQLNALPAAFNLPALSKPIWVALRVDGDLVVGEAVLPLGEQGWQALLRMLKERPAESGVVRSLSGGGA
jgi:hypothetical protein